MAQKRCGCGAFLATVKTACRRCKAAGRRTKTAKRAVAKLQRTAHDELWNLTKLLRALAKLRRRLRMRAARWEPIVRTVFGAQTVDLVDPRQITLFEAKETHAAQ